MSQAPRTAVRRGRGARRGFGLLEAIVALTLLASTGMALFAWINQNLQAASRLRVHEQESRLLLSAQSLIETVNPMQTPSGSIEVSGLAVTWQAQLLEPARANATFAAGTGPWQVGLYRLQVQAQDGVQGVAIRFEQWRVGIHRRVPLSEVLQ